MTSSPLQAAYFQQLGAHLKNEYAAKPHLVIDLDKVDENVAQCKAHLKPGAHFRIVVKSLPVRQLIHYLMEAMATTRLMVFHQPFLTDLAGYLDTRSDVLVGKPMPIQSAAYFYHHLPERAGGFDPYRQIQWLVDSPDRVRQYVQLAKALGCKLRLNIEIDVGLHRGGITTTEALSDVLDMLHEHSPHVECSGLMGYDPHVVKIPKLLRSPAKSRKTSDQFYQECIALIQNKYPQFWHENLTFNGAGSPTLSQHNTATSPLNDIAAGSCFVKPTTFDIPTLQGYTPACFIATPVLKKMRGTLIPGLEKYRSLLRLLSPQNAQSFFLYGGYWKADYVYPETLRENTLFGASTNQTMVNAAAHISLDVDDFVFLRPHQSEFVFLQFGKALMIRGGQIIDRWDLLNND